MRVKALVSFAGVVSLGSGQEADYDEEIALDLIRAGIAVRVGDTFQPKAIKVVKKKKKK